jgi:branched-chain amino acid aminotransferase
MIPVLDKAAYLERLLGAERPGIASLLAFYDHRVGAVCTEGSLLLAPLDDHMFHRGDGVFEALKFVDGRIYQFYEHMDRMKKSASSLRLAPPVSWEEFEEIVLKTVRAAQVKTGYLRVFLGRGPGGFGVDPAECPRPSFYVVVNHFAPYPESWYEKGLRGFRSSMPPRPAQTSHIKDTNYLFAVMMTMEAHDLGLDTPLVFDDHGCLAESAVANICLVDQEGLLVVPEFTHALPGTTIRRAMELLEGKVGCTIRRVPEEDIFAASELLLLGTSPNCASIVEYAGQKIGSGGRGPVSRMLNALIEEDIRLNGLVF